MLVQYFKRPSRIEELRSCPGSHLLEEFAAFAASPRYELVDTSRVRDEAASSEVGPGSLSPDGFGVQFPCS
jgi:hypothetical protein